ncbi:6073_t:CDS:1, partial [Ambispora leptoticha]
TQMLTYSLDKRLYESIVYENEFTDLNYEKIKKTSISKEFKLVKILVIVIFECIYEQTKSLESHGTAEDSDGDMACTEEIQDLSLVL